MQSLNASNYSLFFASIWILNESNKDGKTRFCVIYYLSIFHTSDLEKGQITFKCSKQWKKGSRTVSTYILFTPCPCPCPAADATILVNAHFL